MDQRLIGPAVTVEIWRLAVRQGAAPDVKWEYRDFPTETEARALLKWTRAKRPKAEIKLVNPDGNVVWEWYQTR